MHLTGREAGEHAARANVGMLVLTHLLPWNDPAFAIDWPLPDPVVSERDRSFKPFAG